MINGDQFLVDKLRDKNLASLYFSWSLLDCVYIKKFCEKYYHVIINNILCLYLQVCGIYD